MRAGSASPCVCAYGRASAMLMCLCLCFCSMEAVVDQLLDLQRSLDWSQYEKRYRSAVSKKATCCCLS